MRRRATRLAALAVCGGLLCACGGQISDAYVIADDPGHVEHVDGAEIGRVTLTKRAAERLDITMAPVVSRGSHLEVPNTAVFVDPEGTWWVYTSPEPLVYERHEVVIAEEGDGLALLSEGPEPGTQVVSVGVAELYGVEAEVGH